MDTAISIPDEVYEEAEELAARLEKSRSQLYSEALREYLDRHNPESVTERMNRVCEVVDTSLDPGREAVAVRGLASVEW